MKFTRKEIINEKKGHKRLKVGLWVLSLLLLSILLTLLNRISPIFPFFNSENAIKKPIASQSTQEKITNFLIQRGVKIQKVEVFQNRIEVKLEDGPTVFLNEDNLEKKVTSLQAILERFKIEGRKVKVIDLRFSKPIIK